MNNEYMLDTKYAYALIIVKEGKIIDTANIYKWMRGRSLAYVIDYLKRKNIFNELIDLKPYICTKIATK